MSKVAKIAMALVASAGIVLVVVAYAQGRDSTDGQAALVIPFLFWWTGVALSLVWVLDAAIRALLQRLAKTL